MSNLDQLLYAWLAERDDKKFERAFCRYFQVAFAAVTRYLSRRAGENGLDIEELAQAAMLKFYDKVGPARRDASALVRNSIANIRPLDLGPFHARHLASWVQHVDAFREEAMSFQIPSAAESDAAWKKTIEAIAQRPEPLQRRGCHLLHDAYSVGGLSKQIESADKLAAGALDEVIELIHMWNDRIEITAAERDLPGFRTFVAGVSGTVVALPTLRIPTNGLLFDIALSVFLDELKKWRRLKRGGAEADGDLSVGSVAEAQSEAPPASSHLLEGVEILDTDGTTVSTSLAGNHETSANTDVLLDVEATDFLEKFLQHLRSPVDRALEAYVEATKSGKAKSELHKLQSLTAKYDRLIAILTLHGEGFSQEDIADKLGITRNQVKYVLSSVQESFAHFMESGQAAAIRRPPAGEFSHV